MSNANEWPKHPDGRPKKMGELSIEEQRAQLREACQRLKPVFESPEMRAAIEGEGNEPKP